MTYLLIISNIFSSIKLRTVRGYFSILDKREVQCEDKPRVCDLRLWIAESVDYRS